MWNGSLAWDEATPSRKCVSNAWIPILPAKNRNLPSGSRSAAMGRGRSLYSMILVTPPDSVTTPTRSSGSIFGITCVESEEPESRWWPRNSGSSGFARGLST